MKNSKHLAPKRFNQTKQRGTNRDEYEIYLDCANDGTGHEIGTGEPMKTYEEWLAS